MPAYTPIRDFIEALQSGETNITKRIKYLVINYAKIPPAVQAILTPGNSSTWIPSSPPPVGIPQDVKSLLKHEGGAAVCGSLSDEYKLSQDEVDHIDAWEKAEVLKVLAWVNAAKGDPNAEIYWELRRDGPAHDDAYPDPIKPLKITARTHAPKVYLGWSGFNLGSIKYKP